jgi:hypothetical protein
MHAVLDDIDVAAAFELNAVGACFALQLPPFHPQPRPHVGRLYSKDSGGPARARAWTGTGSGLTRAGLGPGPGQTGWGQARQALLFITPAPHPLLN